MNRHVLDKLAAIRADMDAGRPVRAAWLFMGSPIAAEIMARAGFDLLILDMEHSAGTLDTIYHVLRACDAQGVPVVVRTSGVDRAEIKRALDAGAAGIVIPDLRTADEARTLVSLTTYATAGERGTQRVARASGYGYGWDDYVDRGCANLLRIALIEHAEAINALPDILAVDGLSAIVIGAGDLAASMGHLGNPDHPELQAAIARIEEAVNGAGMVLGAQAQTAEAAKDKFARGYGIVACASDLVFLKNGIAAMTEGW